MFANRGSAIDNALVKAIRSCEGREGRSRCTDAV